MIITILSRLTWLIIFGDLGASVEVHRNDRIGIGEIHRLEPQRIILSPGPGSPDNPRDFGICSVVLRQLSPRIPTLGVCLGHQGIGFIFGGRVRRAKTPVHGKIAEIYHDDSGVFAGLPQGFPAARYHSLVIDRLDLPAGLAVTAWASDGEIMGVRHRHYPIEGIQFHPESILTSQGKNLLRNFLQATSREEREVTVL